MEVVASTVADSTEAALRPAQARSHEHLMIDVPPSEVQHEESDGRHCLPRREREAENFADNSPTSKHLEAAVVLECQLVRVRRRVSRIASYSWKAVSA